MTTRRTIICSLGAVMAISHRAIGSQAVVAGKPTADTPTASVIPGTPPILDFGDDLKIPCDKSAFFILWEGKTFWLTFGAGRSSYSMQAQGQAVKYASAAMKLLLMTLAFTPDRMVKVNGGWRMKPGIEDKFVRGDITLPGLPYWPITDADFTSFGNQDSPALGGAQSNGPSPLTGKQATGGIDPTTSFTKADAFTCYIVLKRDLSLDDVRARAQIVLE